MFRGGSLLYALGICLLMALISGSLILYSYYSHYEVDQLLTIQKNYLNSESGLRYLLATDISSQEAQFFDLFNNGSDFVELQQKNWGVYYLGISKSTTRNISVSRICLIGKKNASKERVALYLADNNKPLSLAGNTLIKGTSYIPGPGVRKAYINGEDFTGVKLIQGEVKKSSAYLMEPDEKTIEEIKSNLLLDAGSNDSLIYWEDLLQTDVLNSFSSKTFFISSSNAIELTGVSLKGNIKIVSKKSIQVSSTVYLEDIILISPEIHIEEGFKGNIQAFATDSIVIDKNCSLSYPTVLAIIKSPGSTENSAVIVNENDSIAGEIISFTPLKNSTNANLVSIAKGAVIQGRVYCNDVVDLKGKIAGSLFASKIVLGTASTIYENHLLNATIDESQLSSYFVDGIWNQTGDKLPVKFVY